MGTVSSSGTPIVFPPFVDTNSSTPATEEEQTTSLGYTPVTSDLYYSGGYLGTLRIPAIGLSVQVWYRQLHAHEGRGTFQRNQHLGWKLRHRRAQPGGTG